MDLQKEFDRQVQNLLLKGYPEASQLTEKEFLAHILPLKDKLDHVSESEVDLEKGHLPFVIVITSALTPTEEAMTRILKDGKEGITKLFPLVPNSFTALETIDIPAKSAYLLIDIDRGKETLNVRPQDALKLILKQERSPLTIDEGVAIVTQYPEFLMKNNCFSLLASRHSGDQRVPAIWINGQKHPNLGWCWDGNPHTWLGSASCKERLS